MRAGNLDRRWTLQRKSTTTDAAGQEKVTWTDLDTVWGSWEPLKGTERWTAKQFLAEEPVRVRIRYYADVSALDAIYLVETDERYDVHSVEQRRREGETVLNVSRRVED